MAVNANTNIGNAPIYVTQTATHIVLLPTGTITMIAQLRLPPVSLMR